MKLETVPTFTARLYLSGPKAKNRCCAQSPAPLLAVRQWEQKGESMADHKELAARLRDLARGTVEYRVADPETGAYCLNSPREWEMDQWLLDYRREYPNGLHANKVVRRAHYFTALERAALEAAEALDPSGTALPHGGQKNG